MRPLCKMEKMKNKFSYVFIGLALFSMYFGSGNLIYPLFVGQLAKDQCLLASLGFFLTGVAVPFLGVIAMIIYKGDYTKFFECLGSRPGSLFVALLLTIWAPLGCCPRCITLAYASFHSYWSSLPLWFFSAVYSLLVYLIIQKKRRMMDILGYILTPVLLLCLALIILKGSGMSAAFAWPAAHGLPHFTTGLVEGYNTIDLIASFFFSASIIRMLQQLSSDKPLKVTFQACLVGISLLGVIYVALIGLAGAYSDLLADIPKDQMLTFVAKTIMGPKMGVIAIAAIFLACLTTSIAQTLVYAEFLQKRFNSPVLSKGIALGMAYVMSLTGLEGISAVTVPILKILYPLLIVMIFYNLYKHSDTPIAESI